LLFIVAGLACLAIDVAGAGLCCFLLAIISLIDEKRC
jgi:hypothetical protein